jgi:zinc protease
VHRRLAIVFTLAFVALLAAPSGAQIPGPSDAGIFTTKLSNGLQVIVVEDRSAPVVQVATWYRFGSLYETRDKTGLAHALEHMLFRGTSNVSAGALDDVTARLGAQMNGQTDYDYTQFYFTFPSDKLDVGLYLEADRMQHASLRQSDWDVERGAVLSELDGDASSPFFDLLSRVRAAAYPDSPHGRTAIGIRTDVANATAEDIATYYHEWYAPNNAALVVSGDVEHAIVFAKVKKYFGSIPAKKLPTVDRGAPVAATTQTVEAAFPFPYEVVDLAYAIPGDTEQGEPAVSTLSTLIPNQRSPFYQALVQTNIALYIDANADTQLKGGLLNVFIVLSPGHSAQEAQHVFQTTMDNLIRDGISDDLTTAAKSLTIAERLYNADSITGFGDLAGYTYGVVGERISDEDSRLAALTPGDLDAALKTFLSSPTVVGHLRPNDAPALRSSNKSDATVTDDFSGRTPSGAIVEPQWLRVAARTPSMARSKLAPIAFTLPNGLRVIFQEKHDRPTFVLRGRIDSSPTFAPYGKEGIARLASSAADYASANYPFEARRKTIDDLGAYVTNGGSFSAQGRAANFAQILAIVADGQAHPTFPDQWFSLNRDQLAKSLQSENNLAGVQTDRAYLHLLLSPDDPALRSATSDSIGSISRDDLLDYTRAYWRPDLTSISVVGDLTSDQVRSAITAAFGSWSSAGPTPSVKKPPLPPAAGGHDYVATDANQVYVRLGQPAVSRTNPDYDAFTVLSEILGGPGAFESRLWQELRQKRGLVYGVSSDLSSDADRGDLRIELNASPQHVQAAIGLVRDQLNALRDRPVSETELTEAKARLVGSALLSEESANNQADELLDILTTHLPLDYYGTLGARYAKVSAADVQRVANEYLQPAKMIEIFSGPQGPWAEHDL